MPNILASSPGFEVAGEKLLQKNEQHGAAE